MLKTIVAGFLLSLVFLSWYKSGKDGKNSLDTKYSIDAMKADFNQLLAQIKNNHPALYDFTGKDEYQEIVKQQFKKIGEPATIIDFYKMLLPLVVKIGCGHSQLWLPQWVWKDSAVGFLPLRLFIEKGEYILSAI